MKNKVSIIIPAYNAAAFIGETIESALNQTWSNIEVIVINDGSTDDTEAVLKKYNDERIVYVKQDNQGCSFSKQRGVNIATGDYIQYLDADDLLSPNKIELQLKAIQHDPGKIAVCKTFIFKDSGNLSDLPEVDTDFLYTTDDGIGFLLNLYGLNKKKGMIQPNAFLLSKELCLKTGPWNTALSPSPDEDGEYFCRAILASSGIVYVESVYNYYRKLDKKTSLSNILDERRAAGLLRSISAKAKSMVLAEDSVRVKEVMASEFADFIYQHFTTSKQLVAEAQNEIKLLGINKIPMAGGKNFRRLASVIGMNNALRLKSLKK